MFLVHFLLNLRIGINNYYLNIRDYFFIVCLFYFSYYFIFSLFNFYYLNILLFHHYYITLLLFNDPPISYSALKMICIWFFLTFYLFVALNSLLSNQQSKMIHFSRLYWDILILVILLLFCSFYFVLSPLTILKFLTKK